MWAAIVAAAPLPARSSPNRCTTSPAACVRPGPARGTRSTGASTTPPAAAQEPPPTGCGGTSAGSLNPGPPGTVDRGLPKCPRNCSSALRRPRGGGVERVFASATAADFADDAGRRSREPDRVPRAQRGRGKLSATWDAFVQAVAPQGLAVLRSDWYRELLLHSPAENWARTRVPVLAVSERHRPWPFPRRTTCSRWPPGARRGKEFHPAYFPQSGPGPLLGSARLVARPRGSGTISPKEGGCRPTCF